MKKVRIWWPFLLNFDHVHDIHIKRKSKKDSKVDLSHPKSSISCILKPLADLQITIKKFDLSGQNLNFKRQYFMQAYAVSNRFSKRPLSKDWRKVTMKATTKYFKMRINTMVSQAPPNLFSFSFLYFLILEINTANWEYKLSLMKLKWSTWTAN